MRGQTATKRFSNREWTPMNAKNQISANSRSFAVGINFLKGQAFNSLEFKEASLYKKGQNLIQPFFHFLAMNNRINKAML